MERSGVRVLGVVTARAGSKGVPGKNTRLLGGRPLISYTIDAARESDVFDRLILSTDDPHAASLARDRGCDVPFMRPPALAADDTPHLPVMQHALTWLREHDGYAPDWVMILQPTSPLRQPWHIRESVDLALASAADSVVSVDEIPPHFNPMRIVTMDEHGWAHQLVGGMPLKRRIGRRQDMPKAWVLNGAICLFRTAVLFDPVEPSLYGDKVAAYRMSPPYGLDIDEPEDWETAERLLTGATAR